MWIINNRKSSQTGFKIYKLNETQQKYNMDKAYSAELLYFKYCDKLELYICKTLKTNSEKNI